MDAEYWMSNLYQYSVQLAAITATAAALARVLRPGSAKARLLFWQAVLVFCLLLPGLQPWHQLGGEVLVVTGYGVVEGPAALRPSGWFTFDQLFGPWLLYLIASGCLLRLAWLAA